MYTQISAYPAGAKCFFLPTLPVLSASFSLLVKLPAPGASTTKKTLIFVTFGHEYKQIVFDKELLKDDPTLEWVTPGPHRCRFFTN
jgi:hypothetical protein